MRLIRPTHAVIDLNAIERNIRSIRARVGPRVRLLVVVKADAYGHGMVETATAATAAGADMFGVANLEEGRILRRAGIAAPVLILGASLPEQASAIIRHRLTPMVCTVETAEALASRARAAGRPVPVHIKVDTGMGRLGVPADDAFAFVRRIATLSDLYTEGIFTHFPCADEADKRFTREQIARFRALLSELEHAGCRPPLAHAANSGAVLDLSESFFDMVRPGLIVYGYYPSASVRRSIPLQPALVWKTRIVHIKRVPAGAGISYGRTYVTPRETTIATLPVGYQDGYFRTLSNRGVVLVAGRQAPVVGRVCMDQIMVDVGDMPDVTVGDEVMLIGRQGEAAITVEGFARHLDTIPHEVVCMIDKRVPRVYVRNGVIKG